MNVNNQSNESYSKPGIGRYVAGVAAGGLTAGMLGVNGPCAKYITNKLVSKFPAPNEEITKSVKDVFERAEVKKHGIKLVECTESTIDKLKQKINLTLLPQFLKDQTNKVYDTVMKGKNAFYSPITNEIIINTEKLGVGMFHEVGHAINNKTSKFWRSIQKSRVALMLMPSVLLLTALFKSKKSEGEKPVGFWDKTTTFIKENVGKLTTLAFIPIIAEEIKASLNGQKIAKQMLSPEAYKNVVKFNRIGALSYIIGAGITGLGAYLGNKVRDAIVQPKSKDVS